MTDTRRSIEERLYALLPAVHRIRDNAAGEPLRALLAILEQELQAQRDDTWQLYDDWFIETCQEWVVPYLGELLGAELVRSIQAEGITARGYVANTLRYRRRKGTATVLEDLSRDVTGWPTRAVEYFERLGWSQNLQHIRLHAPATASLRRATALELVGGPFGAECHTGEVRLITSGRGRYNIPNVGLHLWRLRTYPMEKVDPRALIDEAGGIPAGRYHFNPLGIKGPLWNQPRSETTVDHLAEERDVPARLRRRALYDELNALAVGASPPKDGWFGLAPVLRVWTTDITSGGLVERKHPQLHICHLDPSPDAPPTEWHRPAVGEVGVDPETGRLSFDATDNIGTVLVDYSYAFGGDLGGGPYDRRSSTGEELGPPAQPLDSHHGVSKSITPVGGEVIHPSLSAAIDEWNALALHAWTTGRGLNHLITIQDNRSYVEPLTRSTGRCILIPPGSRLRIFAAQWKEAPDGTSSGASRRMKGSIIAAELRPHLVGNVEVLGLVDPAGAVGGGSLELNGLLLEGSLTVLPGQLGGLAVHHCTLVPGHGGLVVESTEPLPDSPAPLFPGKTLRSLATNSGVNVALGRTIADGVAIVGSAGRLVLADCILDQAASRRLPGLPTVERLSDTLLGSHLLSLIASRPALYAAAIDLRLQATPSVSIPWTLSGAALSLVAPEADANIDTSTLFGATDLRSLEGSESIFVGRLNARVVQEGCLRYCYAPPDSQSPRRFRCQPDLALESAKAAALDAGSVLSPEEEAAVLGVMRPVFTSGTYGHPAFGQLARSIDPAIYTGAEDGAEMGAFHMLGQAHREANLLGGLRQYLRFGVDAGLFFAT
jgi:hypothetical protein